MVKTSKYNLELKEETVQTKIKRMTNQLYKLLPSREEGADWETPLSTRIEELAGMQRLFEENEVEFFSLLCKLEGLFTLTDEDDFFLFRRTIFECLGLMNRLGESLCQD